jgi:hypothetical protein
MLEASERSSTALTGLHCPARGTLARPQRVLRGAPPRIQGKCYRIAATRPQRRAHRSLSLFSDDICGGMLPVRRLLTKELHTSRQPEPDTAHERAMQYCPKQCYAVRPRDTS